MSRLFLLPYTLLVWTLAVLVFVFHYLISVLCLWPFKERRKYDYFLGVTMLKAAFFWVGIRFDVEGEDNIPDSSSLLFIANHQSMLDIAACLFTIPRRVYFVFKKELLKVPFLGRDLLVQGHVSVDRGNGRSAADLLKRLESFVVDKSMIFFPEGTRSVDGKLLSFKRGVFRLALRTGVSIVPMLLDGTGQVLPKGGFMLRPGRIRVVFGQPILVEPIADEAELSRESKVLMTKSRQAILGLH